MLLTEAALPSICKSCVMGRSTFLRGLWFKQATTFLPGHACYFLQAVLRKRVCICAVDGWRYVKKRVRITPSLACSLYGLLHLFRISFLLLYNTFLKTPQLLLTLIRAARRLTGGSAGSSGTTMCVLLSRCRSVSTPLVDASSAVV